jgi:peptide/nickel transport system ATP-binding protein
MITHDLGVIAQLCHRVAVMYAGEIVEAGDAETIFYRPAHPYTQGLLRATPRLEEYTERMIAIEGVPPDLISPPPGCAFSPRCDRAGTCCKERPALTPKGDAHQVSCWCIAKPPEEGTAS